MSRRDVSANDPTSRGAIGRDGIAWIHTVLDTLSEREAGVVSLRFGLTDGRPRTLDEISRICGLSRGTVAAILRTIMTKLRHPSRSNVLRVYEYGEAIDLVSTLAPGILRYDGPNALELCPQCHRAPIAILEGEEAVKGGRRRKYCSNACRQAAYRIRRRGKA
jgi:DNA-binding CsgD family transcriptional regulator